MRRVLAAVVIAVVAVVAPATSAGAATSATHFKNCTAMHKKYKHGVGKVHAKDHVSGDSKPVTDFTRSNALYAANKQSDRDKDGIACEAR